MTRKVGDSETQVKTRCCLTWLVPVCALPSPSPVSLDLSWALVCWRACSWWDLASRSASSSRSAINKRRITTSNAILCSWTSDKGTSEIAMTSLQWTLVLNQFYFSEGWWHPSLLQPRTYFSMYLHLCWWVCLWEEWSDSQEIWTTLAAVATLSAAWTPIAIHVIQTVKQLPHAKRIASKIIVGVNLGDSPLEFKWNF